MSRVYLAAVGNANDPITWSGIPYHFLQAAQTDDLINEGLNLSTAGAIWKARRLLWNFAQLLSGHGAGG
ncbi:MAG TPA: hypothetical protein PKD72_12025, partial [Gemmatales bacterium]|nr:hypothetical protein [Gemmatales bacterium]